LDWEGSGGADRDYPEDGVDLGTGAGFSLRHLFGAEKALK